MASGKNHDLSILAMTPTVGAIAYTQTNSMPIAVTISISHLIGGLFLSPDLDIKQSNPTNRWGIIRFIWRPYRNMIPGHRHFLSHGLLVGSLFRMVYLFFVMSFLVSPYLYFHQEVLGELDIKELQKFVTLVYLGLELSAVNHYFLDGMLLPFPKFVKRLLSK